MRHHSHKFRIADDEAVLALVEKLIGPSQARREKLLRAPDDASRHYKDSNQKVGRRVLLPRPLYRLRRSAKTLLTIPPRPGQPPVE